MTTEPTEPQRTTGRLESDAGEESTASPAPPAPPATPAAGSDWPDLDQLVESVKTKRAEELTREEERRNAVQRASQEAQRVWGLLNAQQTLEILATRLQDLGVAAKPMETLAGAQSAAIELSRLPKGDSATIRIDTSPSRNGPPRTTIQVQRGTQQLSPTTLNTNSPGELRKTLLDVAQKLIG